MTTLDAVNIILAGIASPPVTQLRTGERNEVGEAEDYLDRSNDEIQRLGWACNIELETLLKLPTIRLTVGGSTSALIHNETVTQDTSGATGTFKYELTDGGTRYVYIVPLTGTFNGANSITGQQSTFTRTVSAVATVTTARHAFGTDVLTIVPARTEHKRFAPRGRFLFNRSQQTNTLDWTDNVVVDIVRLIPFTDLPPALANAIAREAAFKFQNYKKRGDRTAQKLNADAQIAMGQAYDEDTIQRQSNVLKSPEIRSIKGWRDPVGPPPAHFDYYP